MILPMFMLHITLLHLSVKQEHCHELQVGTSQNPSKCTVWNFIFVVLQSTDTISQASVKLIIGCFRFVSFRFITSALGHLVIYLGPAPQYET